nr:hypothetical protein [Bacteroidales bacterium]
MGCVFAKHMGLPVKKILVATNDNNEFEVLLQTKQYTKIEPSKNCLSSAMNVGHPSNLARLIELYGGNMDETGMLHKAPDFAAMNRDFYSLSVTDAQTHETIKRAWNSYNVVLEPHGAVGWKCVETYVAQNGEQADELLISLETAHPAKFPEAIVTNIGIDPALPPSLQGIEDKPEAFDNIPANYPAFKEYLLNKF